MRCEPAPTAQEEGRSSAVAAILVCLPRRALSHTQLAPGSIPDREELALLLRVFPVQRSPELNNQCLCV